MNKLKVFLVVSAVFALLSAAGCASSSPQPQPQAQTQAPSKPYVEPPLPQGGKAVEGESLIDKLTWLETYAESGNIYILEISADENIAPRTLDYDGVKDITIIIRGVGENRTVRLSANGTMFTVKRGVRLVLDNNITLMGHNRNTGPVVHVDEGNLWMRTGSCISGNNRDTSEIEGEIRATGDGGGVLVCPGEFEMTGGTISGNTANSGGGVYCDVDRTKKEMVEYGRFTMYGGTISGNTARMYGGGVRGSAALTMHGGTISGNTANVGGGVGVVMGFHMHGGTISGNTARMYGGGVYIGVGMVIEGGNVGLLYKDNIEGGTITGYGSDPINGNVVKDKDGNVLSKPVDKDGNVIQCADDGFGNSLKTDCNSVGHAVFTKVNKDGYRKTGLAGLIGNKDITITGPYRK